MNLSQPIAKAAVLASSILLAGGLVAYRASALFVHPRPTAVGPDPVIPAGEPLAPIGPPLSVNYGQNDVMMNSTKSMIFVPPPAQSGSAQMAEQPQPGTASR